MVTSSIKVTKAQMFASIMSVPAVAGNAEMVAFLQYEIDIVNVQNAHKSNAPKSNAPSKKDVENDVLMERILSELALVDSGMTVSELAEAFNNDYSNRKISALLAKLKNAGKVDKTYEKRVAHFTLV